MAAHESLGRQFIHSTYAELQPGDLIHPGPGKGEGTGGNPIGGSSDTFKELGHSDFVHMTEAVANKHGHVKGLPELQSQYGSNHYEVEPTGLSNPYDWDKTRNVLGPENTGLHKALKQSHQGHWVSLAPVRVKRKLRGLSGGQEMI